MKFNLSLDREKKLFWIVIGVITIIAFVFRAMCATWGRPMLLHPDEYAIVDFTIEMLKRHSWECHFFARPDHFEVKCNSIIFTIFSYLFYKMPAYEAYDSHAFVFTYIARIYTAFFGSMMIPLVAAYTGYIFNSVELKYRRFIQLISSILVAFNLIFVQHSSYSTPDIVLAFEVLLFAFFMAYYVETGSFKYLLYSMIIIGVGITTKYPAAILCIPLAGIVIYRVIKYDKKLINIVKLGIISILVILVTIFLISPNFYTDFDSVIYCFTGAAETFHLGADGLGFFGNFAYYFRSFFSTLGYISCIPFIAGLLFLFINRNQRILTLLVGLIFWTCMSFIGQHWVRWGIPIFTFFAIVIAYGFVCSYQFVKSKFKRKGLRSICSVLIISFCSLVILNTIVSCFAIVKFSMLPDTRYVALLYCNEDEVITGGNTVSEGYTPFVPQYAEPLCNFISFDDDSYTVDIHYATKQYFIMSSSFTNRYHSELSRFARQSRQYDLISQRLNLVQSFIPDGNYYNSKSIIKNIIGSIEYLITEHHYTGNDIFIYSLNPEYSTICSVNGQYLSEDFDVNGLMLTLSDEPSNWVIYNANEDQVALLSAIYGDAVEPFYYEHFDYNRVELLPATGKNPQLWSIVDEGEYCYFVNDNNMALAYDDNGIITVTDFDESVNQRWIID